MKTVKRPLYKRLKFALYTAFAIALIVYIDFFTSEGVLPWLIGGLIIFYAMVDLLVSVHNPMELYRSRSFFFGSIELMIGVVLISFFRDYKSVCIIWASWSIIREIYEIFDLIRFHTKKPITLVIDLIESLVAIVFSITLLLNPVEHHVRVHVYLLFFELTSTVLLPHIRDMHEALFKKEL